MSGSRSTAKLPMENLANALFPFIKNSTLPFFVLLCRTFALLRKITDGVFDNYIASFYKKKTTLSFVL